MKDLKSGVFDSRRECGSSTEELRHEHRKMADVERLKIDFRRKSEMTSAQECPGRWNAMFHAMLW